MPTAGLTLAAAKPGRLAGQEGAYGGLAARPVC
jgi:hypothetical protein